MFSAFFSLISHAGTYSEVAPILAQRCLMCHVGDNAPLGLKLDSFDNILKGSTKGVVVKPADAAGSELIRRIKGTSLPRMPMTGPPYLNDAEIATIEKWVSVGLPKGNATNPTPASNSVILPKAGEPVTYLHIAPILATRCAKCHTNQGLMGPAPEGFLLTSYESTLSARDRVRVVPGNPDASELIRRVRGQALPRMPYDGPPYLSNAEITLLETWVSDGARDANGKPASLPVGAKVRLHGILNTGWKLDGLQLAVGNSTRIDKSPRPGNYVEVRGYLDDSGRVIVERLRRR
ncbi:MAG: c-type cytochrome domain-containing protein [Methylotenera sp.]